MAANGTGVGRLRKRGQATGRGARAGGRLRGPARRAAACVALLASWSLPACATPVDWNGYLTLANDYLYRGVSLLDTAVSLQGGVEARIDDRFVVGAWGANVDRQWLYQRKVDSHLGVNLYAGVDLGCGERCRARILITRYTFPGSSAPAWHEASASIAFAERIGLAASWSANGLGTNLSTHTIEGWYVHPLSRATTLEADVGELSYGTRKYWYTRAGITHRFDRWVVGLSQYWSDPTYQRVGLDDRSRHTVVSVSTAF
jgi:uncharacterized protein (TIGR02001 family)